MAPPAALCNCRSTCSPTYPSLLQHYATPHAFWTTPHQLVFVWNSVATAALACLVSRRRQGILHWREHRTFNGSCNNSHSAVCALQQYKCNATMTWQTQMIRRADHFDLLHHFCIEHSSLATQKTFGNLRQPATSPFWLKGKSSAAGLSSGQAAPVVLSGWRSY